MLENYKNLASINALKHFENGSQFKIIVAVRKIMRRAKKNGELYLDVEVGDAVDTLNFKCWESVQIAFFNEKKEKFPRIVVIDGTINFYKDKLDPIIKSVEDIPDSEYDYFLSKVIEKPDESLNDLKSELNSYVEAIKYEKLKKCVKIIFEELGDEFLNSVAAFAMHHSYMHGLLEHTVHVTRVTNTLLKLYPSFINHDISIAGALLHDVGKVLTYKYDVTDGISFTKLGHLQDHVVLGYRLVRSAGLRVGLNQDWQEQLEHIILSHQGEPEFGAVIRPSTPEAVLVHQADDFDAKISMVCQQKKKTIKGRDFSDKLKGLGDIFLYTKGLYDVYADIE